MSNSAPARPVKKWFGVRRWLAITVIGVLFFGGLVYFGTKVTIVRTGGYSAEELQPFTTNLPASDRVEIESVSSTFERIDKVLDTKILVGSETNVLENLWKSLNYRYDYSVMCHEPGYRIRFYRNGAFITEATVCFNCDNIYFYDHPQTQAPATHLEANFSPDDNNAKKLRAYLGSLFPGHDPDAGKP